MQTENKITELKREYVDDIKNTVVAFANCDGGTIYIGINDDGSIRGVDDADETMLRVTNAIRDAVRPDVTMFVDCGGEDIDGKQVVRVTVRRGTARPYYLRGKGIRPEGVYVRQGASTVPASETAILDMIKETGGDSYEAARSLIQQLTFDKAAEFFKRRGVSFGAAGSTHHCIEDFAIMRAIPNMTVVIPADAYETASAIKACIDVPGPFYLRVGRGMEPLLHNSEDEYEFKIGKAMQLKDGNDVTIISCGVPTRDALIAGEMLDEQGVSAQVINMHTLKPIDEEAIIEAAVKTRRIVTVEEHNIIGGLGDAVASVLAQSGKRCILTKIGIPDEFGPIGKPEDLYAKYKLSSQGIMETVMELMGKEIEEDDWSDED